MDIKAKDAISMTLGIPQERIEKDSNLCRPIIKVMKESVFNFKHACRTAVEKEHPDDKEAGGKLYLSLLCTFIHAILQGLPPAEQKCVVNLYLDSIDIIDEKSKLFEKILKEEKKDG